MPGGTPLRFAFPLPTALQRLMSAVFTPDVLGSASEVLATRRNLCPLLEAERRDKDVVGAVGSCRARLTRPQPLPGPAGRCSREKRGI